MIRYVIIIIGLFFISNNIWSQSGSLYIEGYISYTTSQNYYLKFPSTKEIEIGDTIFIFENKDYAPVFIVRQKSSTSCVAISISENNYKVDDKVFKRKVEDIVELFETPMTEIISNSASTIETQDSIVLSEENEEINEKKQSINGRFSISTNANISPALSNNFQRIRTSFNLNVNNIKNSNFSTQTYVTYRYRYGIDQVNTNLFNDLKIFNLSLSYQDPKDKYHVSIGRKINNNLANIGAIDGLQYEHNLNKMILGSFVGSRPDFTNYTFNPTLFQFGFYLVQRSKNNIKPYNTTLAFAEQQNNFKTDRRFLYFQHNNQVVKNLNLFVSAEMDLFKNINEIKSNEPSLTSVYLSLRYRLNKRISFSGSYDKRRNIIYYESYLSYIDQLLAQGTRQGFRLQTNIVPYKNISLNISGFFRFQEDNPKPTKNYVANLNFNNVMGSMISLNYNYLESYYYGGNIYGVRINKNFAKGRLNAELNFRHINYSFYNSESTLNQNIGGSSLYFNFGKMTSVSISYEGTFEPKTTYHRYFITFNQRIKN